MRRLIPEESDPKYASFIYDPQKSFLNALPRRFIPEESDAEIVEAFYEFSAEIGKIEMVFCLMNYLLLVLDLVLHAEAL
ncbi:lipoxygenase, putative [Medicago truncatula]|uniref:Lipoxygenase, putative n=1 Tax=Medicago truncatula TaxID=3880 RepID=A0A072VAN6_MEDTR|nr:lipoxygenase, putative [Medicago truncatula]